MPFEQKNNQTISKTKAHKDGLSKQQTKNSQEPGPEEEEWRKKGKHRRGETNGKGGVALFSKLLRSSTVWVHGLITSPLALWIFSEETTIVTV